MIEVLPADGVALDQRRQARDVGVGLREARLRFVHRRTGLSDCGLVLRRIDLKQQIAAAHDGAFFVRLRRQKPFDARANLDVIRTERLRRPFHHDRDVTHLHRCDDDIDGIGTGLGTVAAACRDEERDCAADAERPGHRGHGKCSPVSNERWIPEGNVTCGIRRWNRTKVQYRPPQPPSTVSTGRPFHAIWGVCMRLASVGLMLLTVSSSVFAQSKDERSTGLPKAVTWTFNLDAGIGAFGFGNSLYANAHPDPSGELGDNWLESYAKPALSGALRAGKGSFFGKISVSGERTFAAPPPLVGTEASSFMIEDLYVGWRSGKAIGAGEDALELTFGRAPYKIGHGLLLWDG